MTGEGFSCGTESLDTYLRSQVIQEVRQHVTNCFVGIDADTRIVAGFFTIAAASIPTPALPEAVTKKLPRYPSRPAIRVGRLAVDGRFRGRGLGGALLADAARGLASEVAAYAMLVEAKDEHAVAFYEHHGCQKVASQPEACSWCSRPRPRRSANRVCAEIGCPEDAFEVVMDDLLTLELDVLGLASKQAESRPSLGFRTIRRARQPGIMRLACAGRPLHSQC
jgi:ribosomal protein S18 acetylase RimI-like enzyme